MRVDPDLVSAVCNNADWCDLVCRAHGIDTSVDRDVWAAHRRSPPLYPDAITLARSATADAVLRRLENGPGCSVKDSFASVALAGAGFRVLFEAEWIYRQPASATVDRLVWSPATAADAARLWPGLPWPPLLAEPALVALVARASDAIVAGVIANRSPGVAGLSNLVARDADPDEVWAGATGAVSAYFPGLPLVGYESGDDLDAARRAGFATIGPLRVWVK